MSESGSKRKVRGKQMERLKERQRWKKYVKNRWIVAGSILFLLLVLFAIFVPVLSPYSYTEQNVSVQNQSASLAHLFGTDKFGRDIFVRVWYGTRISLIVGMVSMLINGALGMWTSL